MARSNCLNFRSLEQIEGQTTTLDDNIKPPHTLSGLWKSWEMEVEWKLEMETGNRIGNTISSLACILLHIAIPMHPGALSTSSF